MEIEAQDVSVRVGGADVLPPTGVLVAAGRRTLVALDAGADGQAPVALALALTGRLVPTGGRVLVSGHDVGLWGRGELRSRTAVVDVPGVSDPDPVLPLRAAVTEELRAAGRPAGRADARAWLADEGFEDLADVPARDLPPSARTRALAALAAGRPGVEALVLARPDRGGGDARASGGWWDVAADVAARGLGVAVLVPRAEAALLEGAGLLRPADLRAAAGVARAARPGDLPPRPTEIAVEATL
ncbi:hypothetical protein [uncultured Pseudokineococcus sp.]|uniref:hypothetical protein n=1 Tax=uncultured Pseudokineococcus sp. TaxID=1642928 RepID=UPI00260E0D3B|nr:hypothetical protein [uncultured Pseudokineococcus sp.]